MFGCHRVLGTRICSEGESPVQNSFPWEGRRSGLDFFAQLHLRRNALCFHADLKRCFPPIPCCCPGALEGDSSEGVMALAGRCFAVPLSWALAQPSCGFSLGSLWTGRGRRGRWFLTE